MRLASLALHAGFLVTSFALGVASGRQQAVSSAPRLERQPVVGSAPESGTSAPSQALPAQSAVDAALTQPAVDGPLARGVSPAGNNQAVNERGHGRAAARAPKEPPAMRDVAAAAQHWTAAVRADQNYGAGIIADRAGLILTNQHVIDGARSITVTPFGGEACTAVVLDSDSQLDIALLRLPGGPCEATNAVADSSGPAGSNSPANSGPANRASARIALPDGNMDRAFAAARAASGERAPLGAAAPVAVGDEVLAVGSPRKMYFSVSRGMVSFPNRLLEGVEYVQTDLPINEGNSGGPLVDRQGRVVGIVSFILRDSQGLSFALPIDRATTRFASYLVHPAQGRPSKAGALEVSGSARAAGELPSREPPRVLRGHPAPR